MHYYPCENILQNKIYPCAEIEIIFTCVYVKNVAEKRIFVWKRFAMPDGCRYTFFVDAAFYSLHNNVSQCFNVLFKVHNIIAVCRNTQTLTFCYRVSVCTILPGKLNEIKEGTESASVEQQQSPPNMTSAHHLKMHSWSKRTTKLHT